MDDATHGPNDATVGSRSYGTRNRDGTWARGNRAAAGNPNARKGFELKKALLDSDLASPEAVRSVFSRVLRKALGDPNDKTGASADLDACRLYLAYTIGRPGLAVEISGGPDREPIEVRMADPTVLERARQELDAWRAEQLEKIKADREHDARMREQAR